jgi:hypothetical protein
MVELEIENRTGHSIEKNPWTFKPGEPLNILARPLQVGELKVDRRLRVEEIATHEPEQVDIDLPEAEKTLGNAEAELTEAQGVAEQLSTQLADLDQELRVKEQERDSAKRSAALAGEDVEDVAVLVGAEIDALVEEIDSTRYALWAARIRSHEAEAAVLEARGPVVKAKEQELRGELQKAESKVEAAQAERDRMEADLRRVPDAFDLGRKARQARLRASELEQAGP